MWSLDFQWFKVQTAVNFWSVNFCSLEVTLIPWLTLNNGLDCLIWFDLRSQMLQHKTCKWLPLAFSYMYVFLLASFPGLPRFYLPFVFTIIHGSERQVKICERKWRVKMGEAWEHTAPPLRVRFLPQHVPQSSLEHFRVLYLYALYLWTFRFTLRS